MHIYLYLLDCFVASLLAMTQYMTFYESIVPGADKKIFSSDIDLDKAACYI